MSLRKKTLLIIGLTLTGLIGFSYLFSSTILMQGFAGLEDRNTRQNIRRVLEAVSDDLATLNSKAGDWANFDDTYAFVESLNPAFIEANPTDKAFEELQINLLAIVRSTGQLVFSKSYDLIGHRHIPLPPDLEKYLGPGDLLLDHKGRESSRTGIVLLAEGPMMIASRPVLTSEGKGEIRGTLIMGKFLDRAEIERLEGKTRLQLSLFNLNAPDLPLDRRAVPQTSGEEHPVLVRPQNAQILSGYTAIDDLYGRPALLLCVDMPRDIYQQGRLTVRYLLLSLLGIGLVFGVVTLMLLEKLVLSRLIGLSADVSRIGSSGDETERVSVTGNDELSILAHTINGMLDALEKSHDGLHEALSRFEAVVENTPLVAIQGFNREGVILHWNEACRYLYGIDAAEACGKRMQELALSAEAARDFETRVRTVWESAQPIPAHELEVLTGSGEMRTMYCTMFPVSEGGAVAEVFTMGVDLTGRKRAEQEREAANRELELVNRQLSETIAHARKLAIEAQSANVAKSEFLARMSHEIRTPLNAVIGFTDMLLDTPLAEEQIDYTKTIKRSGEALLSLLNDILDFSKIEAGQMDLESIAFDPEVTAFDVCELIYPRVKLKPTEILCRIGDQVPAFVKGDPGRFRQVLVNLMGNAAKFTEFGEIELSLDVETEEPDRVKLHVKVRDTGIGIPAEKLDSIFEAFHQVDSSTTRKYGGTGLGLAICRQLARLMDGDVWAESPPEQGTLFHFTAWFGKAEDLPVRKASHISLAGRKVLTVDDNRTNLEIQEHLFRAAGMHTVILTRADEVLPTLQSAWERGEPFDLCILDIQMPFISGFEVAKRIRKLKSEIAAIPLLAFSSSTDRGPQTSRDVGFDGFLIKPVRRERLLEMLERLLSKERVDPRQSRAETIVTQYSLMEDAKQSVRILLAEDNPANQKLAKLMLTKGGYHVEVAGNGQEAVEKYFSDPEGFDLILMDVQMPEMDGIRATQAIRKAGYNDIPIIAMTANAMKGDREKCIEAGMTDYVPKPIRREVVFEMIRKWVMNAAKEDV